MSQDVQYVGGGEDHGITTQPDRCNFLPVATLEWFEHSMTSVGRKSNGAGAFRGLDRDEVLVNAAVV
jgi:hypothetical protein